MGYNVLLLIALFLYSFSFAMDNQQELKPYKMNLYPAEKTQQTNSSSVLTSINEAILLKKKDTFCELLSKYNLAPNYEYTDHLGKKCSFLDTAIDYGSYDIIEFLSRSNSKVSLDQIKRFYQKKKFDIECSNRVSQFMRLEGEKDAVDRYSWKNKLETTEENLTNKLTESDKGLWRQWLINQFRMRR